MRCVTGGMPRITWKCNGSCCNRMYRKTTSSPQVSSTACAISSISLRWNWVSPCTGKVKVSTKKDMTNRGDAWCQSIRAISVRPKWKHRWEPNIKFRELVEEMEREDLKVTERDELTKRHGYYTNVYHE